MLRFDEKCMTDQLTYSTYGNRLLFIHSYKNLRIMIDSALNFHAHVDAIIEKAYAVINSLLRSTAGRSVEFVLTLYILHNRPIA